MIIDAGKYKIPVLYEDAHLIVVIKPYNLLIQQDKSSNLSLFQILKHYLKNNFLGIVHRLDKVVFGIAIFAKTPASAKNLFLQLQSKKITKIYHAIVEGELKEDKILQHYIVKKNQRALVFSTPKQKSKKATLSYHILKNHNNKTLLEIHLQTGRYNQIRAQLAYVRHPIVNDFKYKKSTLPMTSIALIAKQLRLHHPISNELLSFNISYPENWQTFWEN